MWITFLTCYTVFFSIFINKNKKQKPFFYFYNVLMVHRVCQCWQRRFLHLWRYLQRFLCGVHRVCQCWQNVSLWCATCRPGPNLVFDKVSLYLLTLSFFLWWWWCLEHFNGCFFSAAFFNVGYCLAVGFVS